MPDADFYSLAALAPVVSAEFDTAKSPGPLSGAKQTLAAALILRGDRGVDWRVAAELGGETIGPSVDESARAAAFRMAVSRLRAHLPPNSIVDIGNGWVTLDLPAEEVDVWHLAHLVSPEHPLGEVPPGRLQHLLQPVTAYAGAIEGVLAEQGQELVRRNQRDLLVRLAGERSELLRGSFVDHLRHHLENDPYNERLVATLALVEARAGDRRKGLEVLRQADERLGEHGMTLSSAMRDLETALIIGEDDDLNPEVVPVVPGRALALPSALAELRINRHVGHEEELARLQELLVARRGRAVVTGPSGSGKTRLCAELAARAAETVMPTLYLKPQADDRALDPLRRALGSFRARAEEVETRVGSSGTELASRLLGVAFEALAEATEPAGLVLIVDDVAALDSTTARLVRQLPLADVASRVVLVVVDAQELEDRHPSPVAAELADQPGTVTVSLGLLDETQLRHLIEGSRSLAPTATWNLARQLLSLSGGRAGVAWILLDAVPRTGGSPDFSQVKGVLPLVELIEARSDEARAVGGASSVVGEVDLAAVSALTGLDGETVLGALDELVRHNLVRDLGGDRFEIRHAQVARALVQAAGPDEVREWHRRAAEHFGADVHRRARHEAHVADLLPEGRAVESLIESARIRLATGDHWEATDSYRKATVLSGGRLRLEVEGRMARALDLSGLRAGGERTRDRAFTDALAAGDHALALTISVSGLPEAEDVHSNADLLRRLGAVDAARLDQRSRWELYCHRSRQYGIAGMVDDSLDYAQRAEALAAGPGDRVRARLLRRMAQSERTSPEERLALLEGVAADVDRLRPVDQADYCFVRTIDHYEAGQAAEAASWRRRLDELEDVPVIRRWHAMLFDAVRARDQGRLAEAARLRDEAREFGVGRGITEAHAALRAGELGDAWFVGRMDRFRDEIRPGGVLDPAATVMQRAGAVAAHMACQEEDEALPLAVSVCEEVLAMPIGQRSAALVWVAEALVRADRPDLVGKVRNLLSLRGGWVMVYGAFVTTFGPVACLDALLSCDDEARGDQWREGIARAEKDGYLGLAFQGAAALQRTLDDGEPLARLRADHPDCELTELFTV